jgi:hypothetical protein
MPFDREALAELDKREAELIADFTFTLEGEDYNALKFATMLARRCLSRDVEFKRIEARLAEVMGRMRAQLTATPEMRQITRERREVLSIPPLPDTKEEA